MNEIIYCIMDINVQTIVKNVAKLCCEFVEKSNENYVKKC